MVILKGWFILIIPRKYFLIVQFSSLHAQGDGWIYNSPLWKPTWQQISTLLMDNNGDPSSPHWGLKSGSQAKEASRRSYRLTEWCYGDINRKQARCQSDLHCYNQHGGWSSWDKSTFLYTVKSITIQSRVFLFFTLPRPFCTHTVMKFATGVLICICLMFSQTLFGFKLLVCNAALEWINTL